MTLLVKGGKLKMTISDKKMVYKCSCESVKASTKQEREELSFDFLCGQQQISLLVSAIFLCLIGHYIEILYK